MRPDNHRAKSTRILWVSRHMMLPEQITELESRFGTIEVIKVSHSFGNGKEVVEMAKEHEVDEIVCVLPLNYIAQICMSRYKPIRPIMQKIPTDGIGGYRWSHIRFERINGVKVVTSPIKQEISQY